MYRIDNADATTVLPTPLAPGPVTHGYFQSGNPAVGQKATTVDRDWANALQEEIAKVIEAAGLTLSKTDRTQLWQAITGYVGGRTRIRLTAPIVYYVSPTGSDIANTGLTPASPLQSVQQAYNALAYFYDFNGFQATIQLAAGTYSLAGGHLVAHGPIPGQSLPVILLGNTSAPTGVVLQSTAAHTLSVSLGAYISASGLRLIAGGGGSAVNVDTAGAFTCGAALDFNNCSGSHIVATHGGLVNAGANNYTISANAQVHINASSCGTINIGGGNTVTISGTPTFGVAFADASLGGVIDSNTATSPYAGTTGGTRYLASMNAVIATNGGGASFFPGSVAGSVLTGGQYS